MPRCLAIVVALAVAVPVPAFGQDRCTRTPAKRATAKSREKKAAALLERAKQLLNKGEKDQAVKRLRRIVRRYPRTRAAVEAAVILCPSGGSRSRSPCINSCGRFGSFANTG
jgi:outer membrane protein assembly factor BamD (BamD/ComL family)